MPYILLQSLGIPAPGSVRTEDLPYWYRRQNQAMAQATQAQTWALNAVANFDPAIIVQQIKVNEENRRRIEFARLSKHWLNAMLDVELGL